MGTQDSEQLRVILDIGINMDAGYSDLGIEESEEFKVIGASGFPDQNSHYSLMQYRH